VPARPRLPIPAALATAEPAPAETQPPKRPSIGTQPAARPSMHMKARSPENKLLFPQGIPGVDIRLDFGQNYSVGRR
jgi:hypothetical protein